MRNETEHTLYRKKDEDGNSILISLYVDDMIYTSGSQGLIDQFQAEMKRKFDKADLGLIRYFLGLEIHQSIGGIFISQTRYIEDLLRELNMKQCRYADTPMGINEKFLDEDEAELVDAKMYRSLIGKLLYVVHTRPDICYAVNFLSRFMSRPNVKHLCAAKRVVKYLAGTVKFGLFYPNRCEGCMEGFTDSDWGGSLSDRKSTSGMFFRLGSCAITWGSKKQDVVALSSTEAEYVAATTAACQMVWLRRILGDCGRCFDKALVLWYDNQSTIAVAKNPAFHGRTKHIDVRFHYIRSLIADGLIVLQYCNTGDQLADIFTKPLSVEKHKAMRVQLGVVELQSRGGVDVGVDQ